jgi:uncharacterized protein (DUF433 family)
MCDDELIDRYITYNRRFPGDAKVKETGVPVWIIAELDVATDGDTDRIVYEYRLSPESLAAARAYYRLYREYVDAKRLLATAAYSS